MNKNTEYENEEKEEKTRKILVIPGHTLVIETRKTAEKYKKKRKNTAQRKTGKPWGARTISRALFSCIKIPIFKSRHPHQVVKPGKP